MAHTRWAEYNVMRVEIAIVVLATGIALAVSFLLSLVILGIATCAIRSPRL